MVRARTMEESKLCTELMAVGNCNRGETRAPKGNTKQATAGQTIKNETDVFRKASGLRLFTFTFRTENNKFPATAGLIPCESPFSLSGMNNCPKY